MNSINPLATKLAPHYSHFEVARRLLFTGHSHQAWPDAALDGLKEAYLTTSRMVDTKWEAAFEKTEILRTYLRNYYDDPGGLYTLGQNTHQLLVAWISALDLKNKPKIITTDGEFHSMARQLRRLAEEGVEIIAAEACPDKIVPAIAAQLDDQTAAVMLSRVYFESGLVNPYLTEIAELTRKYNVPLLIDDYHGTNVVPLSLKKAGLEDCYFLIGGYKYLQWGEGNCFLRFPGDCRLRPAITGWFASFSSLDKPQDDERVVYDDGNERFASGTYDPASQFRAAKVAAFFEEQGLTPAVLRQQYLGQVTLLKELFLEQDLDPAIIKLRHTRPPEQNGGFLALRSPFARSIRAKLLEKGVFTDARADVLRMGPAPYITEEQIEEAVEKLAETVNGLKP